MEVKQNERGIYLFFPTNVNHVQKSVEELEKLDVLTNGYWTWTLNPVVKMALEKARAFLLKIKHDGGKDNV